MDLLPEIRKIKKSSNNPSGIQEPRLSHQGFKILSTWAEFRDFQVCLEQGGCLDRDSRIEEDPTLILEPKTEFQAWLKGVSGQGVYPSELRTDPRGIEIYRNCIELADCEDPSISRILSGSKQILMDSFDAERYCSWLGGRLPGPGYALWHHLQSTDQVQRVWVNWKGKTLLASYDSRNISLEPEFSGELGKVQCLWGTPQWNLEEALKNWTRQLMVRQQFDDALVYSRMLHITGYSRPRWPPSSQDQKLDPELTVRIWDETGNLEDQTGSLLSSVPQWSAIPTRFQNELKRIGSEEFNPPIVESSQGLARVDHNRLAEINSGIPKGKLYYELGLVKIQRPETESACLQGYRYARNPIGRPFTRGFQRCWDHPLKKMISTSFSFLSLKKASCSRIQIPGQQIRSYNKLLQNRSSLISQNRCIHPLWI